MSKETFNIEDDLVQIHNNNKKETLSHKMFATPQRGPTLLVLKYHVTTSLLLMGLLFSICHILSHIL